MKSSLIEQIQTLIAETMQWREYHRTNRNAIEASACAIRLAALNQVLEIIKKTS